MEGGDCYIPSVTVTPEDLTYATELRDAYVEEISASLNFLRRMSARNQQMFKMRYGINADLHFATLQEVGDTFGVSRERVSQVIKRAWQYFPENMQESWLQDKIDRIEKLTALLGGTVFW